MIEHQQNSSKYITKEGYIVRNSNPEDWRNHPNGQIIKHYSDIIKGNVLDFGCNHGACTFLLSEIENTSMVVGYDINETAIKIANESKSKLNNKKIEFYSGDLTNHELPLLFDTICSFHTLEHIYPEDLVPLVNKLYKMMNKMGIVIISIPYDKCYEDETHVSFFDSKSLAELFQSCGFTTIECFRDDRWNERCLLTGVFKKN